MNANLAALLVAAALAWPTAGHGAQSPSTRDEPTESSLTIKIKTEFAKDRAVSATDITVENEEDGIVTLGGRAKTREQADQAIKLARDTSGVISVKSNIVVAAESKRGSGGKAPGESAKDESKDKAAAPKPKP